MRDSHTGLKHCRGGTSTPLVEGPLIDAMRGNICRSTAQNRFAGNAWRRWRSDIYLSLVQAMPWTALYGAIVELQHLSAYQDCCPPAVTNGGQRFADMIAWAKSIFKRNGHLPPESLNCEVFRRQFCMPRPAGKLLNSHVRRCRQTGSVFQVFDPACRQSFDEYPH